MAPGERHQIEIAIPADHPGGTFWYHPHRHGSADVQLSSGMAGALIIEGDFDGVPEIAAARERVLILSEAMFDYQGAIEEYDTLWPEAAPRFLAVNGQREPVIRLRPGEVQRWRVVQAAHESNPRLALDGHPLLVIAGDGIARSWQESVESLVVAPGQRPDLLARVVVEGEPLIMELLATPPPGPLTPIADAEITGERTITFTATEPEVPVAETYHEFTFLIDGRRFDPGRVVQTVRLGAVEEWTVVNDDAADHVFHIHTNPFQVTAINGAALAAPEWRDTVIVPRHGSLTFRSRLLDFTGKTVLHCHMMNHEELGMMQVVEIIE